MATIQIADDDARVQYTQAVVANTTQLTIDFPFFDLDDLNVIVTDAAGTDTTLSRGTGTGTFAVVGVSVDDGFSGGYVTLGDSYSAGTDTFTIFRDIPVQRTTDFPTSGPFNISSLNTELDKIIAIEQELETKITRTLQLADSDTTIDLKLPNLDTRKGTTLAFNATTGEPEAGPTISGVNTVAALAADIATLADIEDGTVATDAISDAAAIASDITTVSGISSNVSAVAGNASNINAVNANSSNINTVAGINANVTTVAGISSSVSTAAGISADITAVAADASDIGTVSSNISNVNTVAGISADVSTVAADGTDIGVVAGISSDVTTVSGIAANVTTVASNTSNINAVAADATDIGTVATNIANVNTTASNIANVNTVAGVSSDVTTVATYYTDLQTVAADIASVITAANDLNEAVSEIDTVANSIANVDLVGGSIANVNTVATNLTDINSFANTYFISATAPVSPTTGDLWFDTTASTMKVYDGSGFVNAGSSVNGTSARYSYIATSGQTSFSATYDAGYVDVYLNGVKLVSGTDFTATDGSTVVLATGAAVNDTVDIVGYGTFSVSSAVTLPDGVKASFGNSNDLQIYRDASANVSWIWNTVGDLYIRNDGGSGSSLNLQAKTNEDSIVCVQDAGVSLFYDNSLKLSTTSTGVDVTGGLTTTGNVGIGTSTVAANTKLHVKAGTNLNFEVENASSTLRLSALNDARSANIPMEFASSSFQFISGNVGIGNTNPGYKLSILENGNNFIQFLQAGDGVAGSLIGRSSSTNLRIQNSENAATEFWTNNTERMRIDSSGNLLVGKTSTAVNTQGIQLGADGRFYATSDGAESAVFNRKTSDGVIASFRKDNTTVGSIGAKFSNRCYISSGSPANTGLRFDSNFVAPCDTTGAGRDNAIDLGSSGARYDDIYATNGTIQTSDANEKQQIAALTDAEITAAKAISALFKTFKWNSAVTEKGDAARTHAGVIAQDVQAAMTAAGLDAGDYAFFISTTWWETQTEVPAVEAVEAVYEDVVIPAVLDEDGNEVEAERTEQRLVTQAVEAREAYTRTDTYDTAEEAPEGATERTRMGIRYPELLAFVGAATEQRLANIETRLTALENV